MARGRDGRVVTCEVRRDRREYQEERGRVDRGSVDKPRRLSCEDVRRVVLRSVAVAVQGAVFVQLEVVVLTPGPRAPVRPAWRHVPRIAHLGVPVPVQVLPDVARLVSRPPQIAGHCRRVVESRETAARRLVVEDAVVVGVLPCEEGGPGWAAERIGRDEVGERGPLAGWFGAGPAPDGAASVGLAVPMAAVAGTTRPASNAAVLLLMPSGCAQGQLAPSQPTTARRRSRSSASVSRCSGSAWRLSS